MRLPPLVPGTLLRRYKRFLADVRLDDGREVTAWCPNPGRMTGCMAPGWRVGLSAADAPTRKLRWTWETAHAPSGAVILVHTGRTNALVAEALSQGRVAGLEGYETHAAEVDAGDGSRVDFRLTAPGRPPCWVEVKAVTLPHDGALGAFPDAVTARGRKHLATLRDRVAAGDRAVQLYVLARGDLQGVRPADAIDPAYGAALRAAVAAGVEALALRAEVVGQAVRATGMGAVRLPPA